MMKQKRKENAQAEIPVSDHPRSTYLISQENMATGAGNLAYGGRPGVEIKKVKGGRWIGR